MADNADAWSDSATQEEFRRLRRVGRAWLIGAIVLFAGFCVYVTRQSDHTHALVSHGVQTEGVVLEEPPEAIRCSQVPVPIAFDVDGRRQVHTYFVDGCGGGGLSKGERVTVSYDRSNPDDFVVNGRANEQPLPTLLGIVALVASWFLGVGWVVRARRLHRLRLVLHETPWADVPVRIARFTSPWTKGRWAVELGGPSEQSQPFVTQPASRRMLDTGTEQQLRVAGSGDTRALQSSTNKRPVLARRPRTTAARERARRALESVDAAEEPTATRPR